jgi:hypothetical protein
MSLIQELKDKWREPDWHVGLELAVGLSLLLHRFRLVRGPGQVTHLEGVSPHRAAEESLYETVIFHKIHKTHLIINNRRGTFMLPPSASVTLIRSRSSSISFEISVIVNLRRDTKRSEKDSD